MISDAAVVDRQQPSRGGLSAVLADTWLLISLRWAIGYNGFRSRKAYQQVLLGLLLVVIGGVMAAIASAVGFGIGTALRRFPNVGLEPLLPGLMLTAGTFILLLSSFGSALSSLFLASDLDLLMSAPVDRKAVFISKMLDSMGYNYAVILVTAVPALFAYGTALGYGPLYFLLSMVAVIGIPLFPAGLGALLVMLVARFAPARRVREVLGFFAALVGIGCSLLGQTSRFWFRGLEGDSADFDQFVRSLEGIAAIPLPSIIAGRGLAAAGANDVAGAAVGLAGFLVLTFGFFALCVWLADNLYASGWVRMQSSGTSRRSIERAAREARQSGLLGRAPAFLAITLKDWRVIPRDLRNFAQLLWPLGVLPVIYLNLFSERGRRGSFDPSGLGLGGIDFTGVMIAAGILTVSVGVFSQLAATTISMEGKSWWLLKAAPVSGRELLGGKLAEVLIPFSILSTVLLLIAGIWSELSILGIVYGWLGMQILGTGVLAIAVGCAVPWAKLDWEDPRRMSSGWGSLLAFVLDIVLAIVGGGFLLVPLLVEAFLPDWSILGFIGGLLGCAVVSGALGYGIFQFGVAKLSDVGET